MPATERNAAPTLNERLENLPFTRAHGKLLGISGLGWALDAMDVGLISFVMAALIKEWQLSPTEASWLGSIGFVGMALGATFGGLLADKLGRRYIFALTLLIYGLATGASALATSLGVLLIFRFLVGLGLGAELPVASTLNSRRALFVAASWSPLRRSGLSAGFSQLSSALSLFPRRTAGAGRLPSA